LLVDRTMAIKVAQKRHYYNFNLDPKGARHPMLKMYLLSVTEDNNAKIVGFSKHINELNAKGTVEQSIIQRIQYVRRYLRTLTPEKVLLQLGDKVSFRI
jgi:lysyl-tRNA synthetase class I